MMPLAARPNIFYSASPGLTTTMPQTTLAQHGEQKRPEFDTEVCLATISSPANDN
jgi:hypothetical protein